MQAQLAGRRLLVPDENVSWNLTAIPAAIRIVRREGIDVVITTSPPSSVHLVGAAVKRATGVPWVADLRDSVVAHPHRHAERLLVRAKEQGEHAVAGWSRARRTRSSRVSEAIAEEMRERNPKGEVVTIANGSDFDDFAGIEHTPSETVPDHARRIVLRQARPAAVPDRAAAVGPRGRRRPLPRRLPLDRPRVGGGAGARRAARADPVRAAAHARSSCSATRRSLLLLIPEAGGRGKGVLSGKVFEYLAAERPILAVVPPDGAAAELIRDVGRGRGRRARGRGRDREPRCATCTRAGATGRSTGERRSPTSGGQGLAPRARRGARAAAGAHRVRRATSFLFLASVFCVTFEKVHWNVAGTVSLADVLAILFLARVRGRDAALARAAHDRDAARVLRVRSCSSTSPATSTSSTPTRSRSGRRGWRSG